MRWSSNPQAIPHTTLASISARLGELDHHRTRITGSILALERTGTIPVPAPERKPRERRAAALALLASDAAVLAVEGMTADAGESLTLLHRLRTDIDEAQTIGGQHAQALGAAESAARAAVHKKEYVAAMNKICSAVIALERGQQERDRIIKDVLRPPRGGTPIEGAGWPGKQYAKGCNPSA